MSVAQFRHMKDSTQHDWDIIQQHRAPYREQLPDRLLQHLKLLAGFGDTEGFPIDRLEHSLQTATLAVEDGRDDEYVICALLHDIGDTLGCYNHADVAASILKPFVSPENHWMVQHHGIFQGYYFWEFRGRDKNARDKFLDHPWYAKTAEFVEKYDGAAFDPARKSLPLTYFEPLLHSVFSKPQWGLFAAKNAQTPAQANSSDPVASAPSLIQAPSHHADR
ncbi:HD domain-containing protein [Lampropedia puyangensis]|uniref:HD domain-containing protein n=1 Tax=Lampropedia puyangensis TaxID=1330072 RepID=A0A4S8EUA3_9BURK|nr:HD domain-containing protein [Lampropedia puyangensis]THT98086.1 HD domain-containing protein [Lampropedia puyangensis]